MIVLDTNAISELTRAEPHPGVVAWFNQQRRSELYVTAVTLAELRYGVALMPIGARRSGLTTRIQLALDMFAQPILPFDAEAAELYAVMVSAAAASGRAVSTADGMIAAIAASKGFTVATRDVGPFEACGVRVVNPFAG